MEDHLKKRPQKRIYQEDKIDNLRNEAIEKIKLHLLPDEKIIKIILIGSSVKNTFGEYDPPGFRGSLFSDFDFIIIVEDDYQIPEWLDREPDGKPFSDDSLNLAYRNAKYVDDKYDIEVFFVKRSSLQDHDVLRAGEKAGIPMTPESTIKHLVVYSKG